MTIKELKAKLETCPDDKEIYVDVEFTNDIESSLFRNIDDIEEVYDNMVIRVRI